VTIMAEEEVLTAAELDLAVDTVDAEITASEEAAEATEQPTEEPFLIIEKGTPTDQEIAALVCVLRAAANTAAPEQAGPRDLWGNPAGLHRDNSPFSPYAYPRVSKLRF
jgi:acyl-CoA carboxylase epsilon subunit